jgi:hypothetical protein
MDFILFYSQFSNSSRKLLEEYPSLSEKSVSVDSTHIRNIIKKMSIVCVPTLLLYNSNNKIIERIIGYEHIVNWITIYIYNTQRFMPKANEQIHDEQNIDEQILSTQTNELQYNNLKDNINDRETLNDNQTNLDDLILEDNDDKQDYHITRSNSGNGSLLKMAEEMKKERDNGETLRKRI